MPPRRANLRSSGTSNTRLPSPRRTGRTTAARSESAAGLPLPTVATGLGHRRARRDQRHQRRPRRGPRHVGQKYPLGRRGQIRSTSNVCCFMASAPTGRAGCSFRRGGVLNGIPNNNIDNHSYPCYCRNSPHLTLEATMASRPPGSSLPLLAPPAGPQMAPAGSVPSYDSDQLFAGSRRVVIVHAGREYSLRLTAANKLILTA